MPLGSHRSCLGGRHGWHDTRGTARCCQQRCKAAEAAQHSVDTQKPASDQGSVTASRQQSQPRCAALEGQRHQQKTQGAARTRGFMVRRACSRVRTRPRG